MDLGPIQASPSCRLYYIVKLVIRFPLSSDWVGVYSFLYRLQKLCVVWFVRDWIYPLGWEFSAAADCAFIYILYYIEFK